LPTECLRSAASRVLNTVSPEAKAALSRDVAQQWFDDKLSSPRDEALAPPDRPARPARPELVLPRDVPRRTLKRPEVLLHAIAHIELNAIDLAWDLIARFREQSMPSTFFDDWVRVADDEARHFLLLEQRLRELGSFYGEWPAHDGLWEAAEDTRHDLRARLAIVPLVLEARGLDVTPAMIQRFRSAGDKITAEILETILAEEIDHVRAGHRWFEALCRSHNQEPSAHFKHLLRQHYKGRIKPPFNVAARAQAGLPPEYYS
jgi:uncharacterized ferritin-like protein (DUF455 family)